jgi:hypothetical protein
VAGFFGGRLLVELQRCGMAVRCLARRPEFLLPKVAPETEAMAGDVLDRDSLAPAMCGIETAVPVNQTIFMLFISLSLFPSNEREIHIGTQAEKAGSSFATGISPDAREPCVSRHRHGCLGRRLESFIGHLGRFAGELPGRHCHRDAPCSRT